MTDPIIHSGFVVAAHHRKAGEVLPFIDAYVAKKEQKLLKLNKWLSVMRKEGWLRNALINPNPL